MFQAILCVKSLHLGVTACLNEPKRRKQVTINREKKKKHLSHGLSMHERRTHVTGVCVYVCVCCVAGCVCVCVCALFRTLTPIIVFSSGETEASLPTPLGIPDAHKITSHFLGVRQEEVSPLKDSLPLQLCILFQIVVFRQFSLFIRFKIDGSQSGGWCGVNKCLHRC